MRKLLECEKTKIFKRMESRFSKRSRLSIMNLEKQLRRGQDVFLFSQYIIHTQCLYYTWRKISETEKIIQKVSSCLSLEFVSTFECFNFHYFSHIQILFTNFVCKFFYIKKIYNTFILEVLEYFYIRNIGIFFH